ncbi:MAG: TatD family deoxyribonuclease [Clostridia bacterium]|nr:TatD family deoxyribonuclease [Clostridia bacterium]
MDCLQQPSGSFQQPTGDQLPPLEWIDSHAHLQGKPYAQDLVEVLARSHATGVHTMLLPGTDLADSQTAIDLALRHPGQGLVVSVGVHPHDAKSLTPDGLSQLRELVLQHRSHPVVAIGEIGLDYHYDFSPRDVQRDVFRAQLELAQELDLPVIVHDREATADCLSVIAEVAAKRPLREIPGVFHCYSGSVETAVILLKMGFYLGFDGPITFKNARKALEVIASCPHDRLVLETDSPYLTPVPHRGHRNTPEYIPLIGAKVAEIWGCDLAEVAVQTTANARKLFGLS